MSDYSEALWIGRRVRLWFLINSYGIWRAGEDLLLKCVALNEEIEYHLRGASQARCRELLYDVVSTTLVMLDTRARVAGVAANTASEQEHDGVDRDTEDGNVAKRVDCASVTAETTDEHEDHQAAGDRDAQNVSKRLSMVSEQVDRAAKRTLQFRYLAGMAIVGVLSAVAAALIVRNEPDQHLLWASAAAGAAGAVVSTLVRMSDRRGLRLARELVPREAFWLGVARTFLGVVFGGVLYLLLMSGLVSLGPADSAHRVEFYSALAFVAGFSERLVPDTLGVVGALVATSMSDGDRTKRTPHKLASRVPPVVRSRPRGWGRWYRGG